MILKITILLPILMHSECVYIYSSFWEPLFNPRILNYHVDTHFEPDLARSAGVGYEKSYGYRGERLIASLGNGKLPNNNSQDKKVYGDVKLYSTYYPGPDTMQYIKNMS